MDFNFHDCFKMSLMFDPEYLHGMAEGSNKHQSGHHQK